MLKAGDIVEYRGFLFIVTFEENGWLQMSLVRDSSSSVIFDNYNNFIDDLSLVVGSEGETLEPNLRPLKQRLPPNVFNIND